MSIPPRLPAMHRRSGPGPRRRAALAVAALVAVTAPAPGPAAAGTRPAGGGAAARHLGGGRAGARSLLDDARGAVDQHGGQGGHLPGSRKNVELVGRADIDGAAEGRVADVSAFGDRAFLTVRDPEGCSDAGVAVVDISDPSAPRQVGFIDATEGSFPGEGSQVVHLATRAFTGQVLVFNNEVCGDGGEGGVSLWDVTDPDHPAVLAAHAGDGDPPGESSPLHEVHSAFAWQAGKRAFVVASDDEEQADVDILEITDPRHPVLVSEVDLDTHDILQPDVRGQQSFLHDMVVTRVRGTWTMLASYWDGGWALVDVDDPARPVFLADSDFPDPDPLTGLAKPEGNAHQAELSPGGRLILATDEDFSPYRAQVDITTGAGRGSFDAGEFSFAVPVRTYPGGRVDGPTAYGGRGCPGGDPLPAPSGLAVEPGQERIVVLERGGCLFSEKVEAAQDAGYDAAVIANHHEGAEGGASPDAFACGSKGHEFTPRIAAVCLGHRAFHLLFGSTPTYAGADEPAVGTVGETVGVTTTFDGWGDVRLLDARTLEELDAFAVDEALDPAFASGSGDLSAHEVAVDPRDNGLAYLSYYAAGLRVLRYDRHGLEEVGHYVDPAGNNFWGVEVHRLPGRDQPLVLASDRDSGLWIFRYTGPVRP